MSPASIRAAEAGDLSEIVHLYNHYVTATHITFDIEPFTVDQRRRWFRAFSRTGPHRLLVAEVDSQLAGYASSTEFRAKRAYAPSVETTIYLDPGLAGRGIGRVLYAALLELLTDEETVHRTYGGVALPNARSVALHESLGFTLAGTFREVGLKFGKYWDVSWYEKDVSGRDAAQQGFEAARP